MQKNNLNRWEQTKEPINDIIIPAYTDLTKRYVSYIEVLDCPQQFIADMLIDLADVINDLIS